jgi:hypothetical protein
MKGCLIMYNSLADREVFSVLKTNEKVKHYIKWDGVRGTGSGGLQVLGPLEEADYCAVLVILSDGEAEALYSDVQELRAGMLRKTGLAVMMFPVDKIG